MGSRSFLIFFSYRVPFPVLFRCFHYTIGVAITPMIKTYFRYAKKLWATRRFIRCHTCYRMLVIVLGYGSRTGGTPESHCPGMSNSVLIEAVPAITIEITAQIPLQSARTLAPDHR